MTAIAENPTLDASASSRLMAAEDERAAVRGQSQSVGVLVLLLEDDTRPGGLERPAPERGRRGQGTRR